jgi:mannosyltransferase OCH1-like enzyme
MIEKNIFQSWYTRDLNPLVQQKINTYIELNPRYKYHLYLDEDMNKFVNEYFPGVIADSYNKLNIIVAKVDFWRYLILYKYGGIYLDMDSSIELPLDSLINDDDEAIITAEGNPNLYVQWGLIFKKEHPILKRTIDRIIENIRINRYPNDIHKMTGPTVYTEGINEIHRELFNEELVHSKIDTSTDITYSKNNISYRIYGKDYNQYFCFKHIFCGLLYNNKKHWRQEEKEKPLIIC